jgi:hypothetical protein
MTAEHDAPAIRLYPRNAPADRTTVFGELRQGSQGVK